MLQVATTRSGGNALSSVDVLSVVFWFLNLVATCAVSERALWLWTDCFYNGSRRPSQILQGYAPNMKILKLDPLKEKYLAAGLREVFVLAPLLYKPE